jgi:hypothetical protein
MVGSLKLVGEGKWARRPAAARSGDRRLRQWRRPAGSILSASMDGARFGGEVAEDDD